MTLGASYIIATLIAAAVYGLRWWSAGYATAHIRKTDARYYKELIEDGTTVQPFYLRWLIPYLVKWAKVDFITGMKWATATGLIVSGPALVYFLSAIGLSPVRCLIGVLLWTGLAGIFHYQVWNWSFVDPWANTLGLVAMGAWLNQIWWLFILALIVAACVRETTPLVVALTVWSVWPLLFLAVPAIRRLTCKPAPVDTSEDACERISSPFMGVRKYRWDRGHTVLHYYSLVLPWGACLIALYNPTWHTMIALLVGWSFLLVATETDRLYQHFSAPTMVAVAAPLIPMEWAFVVLTVHHLLGMRDGYKPVRFS